jgi:hypothetical protein
MVRKQFRDTADTGELEEGQELTPALDGESSDEHKTLTLRLLRNCFVQGALGKKGQEFTFPREEALERMRKTNGVWESVDSK